MTQRLGTPDIENFEILAGVSQTQWLAAVANAWASDIGDRFTSSPLGEGLPVKVDEGAVPGTEWTASISEAAAWWLGIHSSGVKSHIWVWALLLTTPATSGKTSLLIAGWGVIITLTNHCIKWESTCFSTYHFAWSKQFVTMSGSHLPSGVLARGELFAHGQVTWATWTLISLLVQMRKMIPTL